MPVSSGVHLSTQPPQTQISSSLGYINPGQFTSSVIPRDLQVQSPAPPPSPAMSVASEPQGPPSNMSSMTYKDTEMAGIGITVDNSSSKPNLFVVSKISAAGSTARNGKIRVGDLVLQVDAEAVDGWDMARFRQAIFGTIGSIVTLKVQHEDEKIENVPVIRGNQMYWRLTDEIERLREVRDKQEQALTDFDSQLKKLEHTKAKMQADMYQQMASERAKAVSVMEIALKNGNAEHEKTVHGLKQTLSELNTDFESSRGALVEDATTKTKETFQAREQARRLQEQVKEQEMAYGSAKEAQADLSKKLSEANANKLKLQQNLTKAEAEIQALESKNKELAAEVTVLKKAQKDLESRVSEANKTKNSLQEQLATSQTQNSGLEGNNKQKTEEISALKKLQATLEDDKKKLQEQFANCMQKLRVATQAEADANVAKKDLELQIPSLKNQVASLETQKKTIHDQLIAAQESQGKTEKALNKLTNESAATISDLKAKLKDSEASARDLKSSFSTLQKDFDALKVKSNALESRKSEADMAQRQTHAQNTNLLEELTTIKKQLSAAEARASTFKGQSETLQKSLTSTEAKATEMEIRANDLAGHRDRLQNELDLINQLPNPVGIGLRVVVDKEAILVKSLIDGMSAQLSGSILESDEIYQVDGTPVRGKTLDDLHNMLRGKRGSLVKIGFKRPMEKGVVKEFEVILKRGSFAEEYAAQSPEQKDATDTGAGYPKPSEDNPLSFVIPTLR